MPTRLERELEERLVARVKIQLHVETIKLNLTGSRGWPDRLFLLPVRPALVEFKVRGERPTVLQTYRLATLNSLNYDTLWTADYDYAYEWIKNLLAARLSETGNTIDDWASLRRAFTRSWVGENKHILGR